MNGAIADAEATLERPREQPVPDRAHDADAEEQRQVGRRIPGVVVLERDHDRHQHRAAQARDRTAAPSSPRRRACGSGSGRPRRLPPRPARRTTALSSISVPGRTISSMPTKPAATKPQRGNVMRSSSSHPAIRVTRIGAGVIERGRLGQRQILDRGEKAQRRRDQHDAAHQMQAGTRRAHQIPAHRRRQQREHQQRLHAPARPDQQRHRIALAQVLDGDVDAGEAGARGDDQQRWPPAACAQVESLVILAGAASARQQRRDAPRTRESADNADCRHRTATRPPGVDTIQEKTWSPDIRA